MRRRPAFLFSLVAPQTLGGARDRRVARLFEHLARSRCPLLGGGVLSRSSTTPTRRRWRENVADAGLEDWVELLEGDALELVPVAEDVFDVVFIDAEKTDYERYFAHAATKVEAGGLVVADNVSPTRTTLGGLQPRRARAIPSLSTTVPLDRGLELSVVLTESL